MKETDFAQITACAYYPHAFTEDEVTRYYKGWRPSKLLVLWWRITLFFKELYWRKALRGEEVE